MKNAIGGQRLPGRLQSPSATVNRPLYRVLLIRSLHGLTVRETATRLALPHRQIRLQHHRALKRFREFLAARGSSTENFQNIYAEL